MPIKKYQLLPALACSTFSFSLAIAPEVMHYKEEKNNDLPDFSQLQTSQVMTFLHE